MANRSFASVRSMVEAGENVGAYISDPALRAEVLRATGAGAPAPAGGRRSFRQRKSQRHRQQRRQTQRRRSR